MSDFFGSFEDRLLQLQKMAGTAKAATKSDLEEVSRRASTLKKLIDEDTELTARYKIEIHFEKGRTSRNAFTGILVVFKTGVLSGGGDEILYPCPDDNCPGFIADSNRAKDSGQAVCPQCHSVWHEKQLKEIKGYKRTVEGWADVIAKTFRRLDSSADIFLKTHWSDLRKAAIKESIFERRGDDLYDARKDRVVLRYALGAILKDTSSSSLESRVAALLRA